MTEANRPKSISLSSSTSPYEVGARYLVIPADLDVDIRPCSVEVLKHSGTGAWLSPVGDDENTANQFPPVPNLLLIEFKGEVVYTHHVSVLTKKDESIFVSVPSQTDKEKSLLAPSTGRFDYRIEVNLPVRVKTDWVEAKDAPPKLARLVDLSRGGMALLAPRNQRYREGQEITIRVVGWDHPVRIEAVVDRIHPDEGRSKQRVALKFPTDADTRQREMVSSFILQVQRREALGRALPTADNLEGY